MKKIIDFTVKQNNRINEDVFLLELFSEELPDILAGQFVNVKVNDSETTFLRRPISVHDVDYKKHLLYLLVKIVGEGTEKLSKLKKDELVNIILPLGNSFTIHKNSNCLLVGGGIGIAPLYHLSKDLYANGSKPDILIGVRSKLDVVLEEKFSKYANLYYTTEDGSYGEKGYPTNHSILENKYDHIQCCGPLPMMKAIANYAYKNEIDCEVSLENTMACGIGACLCCVNDTKEGNKCVCTDGPIFNINTLKWQN